MVMQIVHGRGISMLESMRKERATALVLLCILTLSPDTGAIGQVEPESEFAFGFVLDDVENDGEISGVPGHTFTARGSVTLHGPEAGVSAWSFGFGANGAGVSIADWIPTTFRDEVAQP